LLWLTKTTLPGTLWALTSQCCLYHKWQYVLQVYIFRCTDLSPLWTCYAFSPLVWHCTAC